MQRLEMRSSMGNLDVESFSKAHYAAGGSSMRRVAAVSIAAALLLGGCMTPANKEMMKSDQDIVMEDVQRLNDQLVVKLAKLKSTGLTVRSEDARVRIVVPDVFFGFGKSSLSKDARSAIAAAAELLTTPDYKDHGLRIEGYTDSIGSVKYNLGLSTERALAVEQELVFSAIRPERIDDVRGFGEDNPIAPNTRADGNDNPQGRAKNRRVEIVIVDKRLTAGR